MATQVHSSDGSGAELDPEVVIEGIADSITRRGLGNCAIFLLESVKPLNFVGSQLMYALGPVANLLFNQEQWEKLANTLEDRGAIDVLIARLEQKERESSQKS